VRKLKWVRGASTRWRWVGKKGEGNCDYSAWRTDETELQGDLLAPLRPRQEYFLMERVPLQCGGMEGVLHHGKQGSRDSR
jgi:hypothetical protein